MKFYSVMQLNATGCKQLIKGASSPAQRHKYQLAFVLKNILCTLFAITFIIALNHFFGEENSTTAVVIFCILLTVRFVDFGYHLSHSIGSLFLVFFILTFGTYITSHVEIFISFIFNFIFIMTIMLLTCHNPLYSNQLIYVFGYLLIQGNPVAGHSFILRVEEMLFGFLLCSLIFYIDHRRKQYRRNIKDILREFNLYSSRTQWQLRLTLGVSLVLMLGQFLHLPRTMWLGISALSILQPFEKDAKIRSKSRSTFVIIGSILFGILYFILPTSFHKLLGPISGVILGFCATYHWTTVFNCFGALITATSIYGILPAIFFRILNNLIGCSFAYWFHIWFQRFYSRCLNLRFGKSISIS